ncbi:MAG: gamma-glutamyl-gamma-aminobutyrate hydrolase family protein [Candidatus Cloacimonetes bacterium]|nr:gamma-glutamyl-gamma-aminobutyrate hydrolase family protein [Candidatus Cloacimonadota bacterium]
MRRIGITGRLVQDHKTGEIRDCLDIGWAEYINSLGYEPYHVLYTKQSGPIPAFDALILSGGNSLSSVEDNSLSVMRDDFESHLYSLCTRAKIPVLGVCRGAQLIWQMLGGQIGACHNHAGTAHSIEMAYVPEQFIVESYHDYCLLKPQSELDVEIFALSLPDKLTEGFWAKSRSGLGIMWHPERHLACSKARGFTDHLIRQFLGRD